MDMEALMRQFGGGAGGLGGAPGGAGFGGDAGDEEGGDDDDLPDLEGEHERGAAGRASEIRDPRHSRLSGSLLARVCVQLTPARRRPLPSKAARRGCRSCAKLLK